MQFGRLARQPDRNAQGAGQRVEQSVGGVRLGRRLGWKDLLGPDQGWLGGVALEIDELRRQPHAGFPVHDRVVELLQQGRARPLETVHDEELPQRAGALERVGGEQDGEVEQLVEAARTGQRDVADVEVEIEAGVVHPRRWRQAHRAGLHALAQPRDDLRGSVQPAHQARHVGRTVEDGDVGDVGREERILLEPPEQALGLRHAPIEPHANGD
jgi:hypothetical protein